VAPAQFLLARGIGFGDSHKVTETGGERNFRLSLKSDGRNGEGHLFIKISLTLVCLMFVLAESQAQTNRKNELGLLLGATVTPKLEATTGFSQRLRQRLTSYVSMPRGRRIPAGHPGTHT